jgi:hypothetical protein
VATEEAADGASFLEADMDGLKPASSVTRPGVLKNTPGSVSPVGPTELPPARAVTAVSDGAPHTRYNSPQDGHTPPQAPHEYVIDPDAREVIYRAVDVRTEASGHPTATDTALVLRAYRTPQTEPADAAPSALEKTA